MDNAQCNKMEFPSWHKTDIKHYAIVFPITASNTNVLAYSTFLFSIITPIHVMSHEQQDPDIGHVMSHEQEDSVMVR